jgi:hypothetical protein
MAAPETATIEMRSLQSALTAGDRLAWQAFTHAAASADGLEAHPVLGRCVDCHRPWTDEAGPLALVVAHIGGERAAGLLCEACAHQEPAKIGAMLERILHAMLPPDARVFDKQVMWHHPGPVGHA